MSADAMPEYGPDVVAELTHRVAQHLDCWGFSARTAIEVLNLSENATFALSEPGAAQPGAAHHGAGRQLVLRVHRVGYSSAEEIESELAWIAALRQEGVVETAAPVPARDGAWVQTLASRHGAPPRFAVAFERLPGREPDSREAVAWFARLGEATARLHRHARTWRRPAGFRRRRWDVEAMVGEEGCWGNWRKGMGLTDAGEATLAEAIRVIRERLARYGTEPDRFGLVHADLRLANLLVDGSRLAIIDFDDCGFSWFGYDFATAVSFIEHEPQVPHLLEAWLDGYRRVADLDSATRAELPTFLVLRRILLMAWLASHAEVPFARTFGLEFTHATVDLAQAYLRGRLLSASGPARRLGD